MSLQVTGRVIKKLAEQNGESARGQWKKQDVIIETMEQYPKKVALSCWGERADELARYNEGDTLTASISIESREYNERWYTDVRVWKLENSATGATPPPPPPVPPTNESTPASKAVSADETEEDLPF